MKVGRGDESIDINLSGEEWFIGDEEWSYRDIQVSMPENTRHVMKRVPTPYPSYESFTETCKHIEPNDAANFCNILYRWITQIGCNIQILYKKLLFK
jgi:hypothetical protein